MVDNDDKTVVLQSSSIGASSVDSVPQAHKARIVCVDSTDIDGAEELVSFDLDPEVEYILGRDSACALFVNSRKLSRKHARITFQDGTWVLEDLGSTNGTFINRNLTTRTDLKAADEVAFGSIVFRFEIAPVVFEDIPAENMPPVDERTVEFSASSLVEGVESESNEPAVMAAPTPTQEISEEPKKSPMIIVLAVLVAAAGGGAYFMLSGSEDEPAVPPLAVAEVDKGDVAKARAIAEAERLKVEIEARRKSDESASLKASAEADAKRWAEQEALRKEQEASRLKMDAEAEKKRIAEEGQRLKAEAEAEARRKLEAAERFKTNEDAARISEDNARKQSLAQAKEREQTIGLEGRKLLQHGLKDYGHLEGDVDGIFGRGSRSAIQAFQSSQGALETGYLSEGHVALLTKRGEQVLLAARQQAEAEAAARRAIEDAARQKAEAAAKQTAEAERAKAMTAARQQAEIAEIKAKKAADAAARMKMEAEAEKQTQLLAQKKADLAAAADAKLKADAEAQQTPDVVQSAVQAVKAIASSGASSATDNWTGRQILDEVASRHDKPNEFEIQDMTLVDKGGREEKRELRRFQREVEKDENRFLSIFVFPAGVKGVSLLTWQHKDKDDDQWLYLPAQGKKMKRVAKGGKKNYFMGTDYTFEDLVTEPRRKFDWQRQPDEALSGAQHFVVKAVPSDPELKKKSGYKFRMMWITKDTFMGVRTDFFDRRGRLIKRQTGEDPVNVEGTLWRMNKNTMEHFTKKHKTITVVTKRSFDASAVPEKNFRQRTITSGKLTR